MTTTQRCPACDALVSARSLTNHQRGMRCHAAAETKRLRAEGYTPVPSMRGNWGEPFFRAATSYQPGNVGRRARINSVYWAPLWAAVIWRLPFSTKHRRKLLRAANDLPSGARQQLADAVVAITSVGAPVADFVVRAIETLYREHHPGGNYDYDKEALSLGLP